MLVIIFMMLLQADMLPALRSSAALQAGQKTTWAIFLFFFLRITTRILLPFSIVGGLLLVWQGVPQNFEGNVVVETLEGTFQVIAMGPIAALEIIKHLGNERRRLPGRKLVYAAENPTMLSNLIELYSMMPCPAHASSPSVNGARPQAGSGGRHAKGRRLMREAFRGHLRPRGTQHFAAMGILFVIGLSVCFWAESQGNRRWRISAWTRPHGQYGGQGGALLVLRSRRCSPPSRPLFRPVR